MIDLGAIFAPRGPLARTLPAFEARPQQTRMAGEVMGAIASGGNLLIEAGTGVGKSIAYLIPAILWAVEGPARGEERRVVVSTHTRALQEQLARKDLPFLERALARERISFRQALLMGAENYLCAQRLGHLRLRRELFASGDGPVLEALSRHADSAPSGLRSEIPFAVPDGIWTQVRRDLDVCLGPRGPLWEACLYRRDLARSREAHLLIVNHALFFLDLATGGRILPPHQVAILDEAHRVEEVASSQFGTTLSDRMIARLLDDVARIDGVRGAAGVLRREAALFFDEMRQAARATDGTPVAARVRRPAIADDRLRAPLEDLGAGLSGAARAASDGAEALTLASLAERAALLKERSSLFLSQKLPEAVYWIESGPGPRANVTLRVTPVEVAAVLRERLFDGRRSVVLTSATLTASGSFAHVRGRLGMTVASEALLGSPYDYEHQALLYLPRAMPDPVQEPAAYADAVARECGRLIAATRGGAFVLFTSYGLLNRVHDALSDDARLRGFPLFRQTPGGGASSILEKFRMTRRGVLFGTLTFWQGVDVPGEALRSVIITRLPFEVPDHPVAEGRAELIRSRGGDPFTDDALPEAILTFRQGFGRLIRSHDDRGLVAALDPRLLTRGYGETFLDSLPPCPRTDSIEQVRRFFGGGRDPASGPAPQRVS
jgi:ATP-dependent DNA helicase DinG